MISLLFIVTSSPTGVPTSQPISSSPTIIQTFQPSPMSSSIIFILFILSILIYNFFLINIISDIENKNPTKTSISFLVSMTIDNLNLIELYQDKSTSKNITFAFLKSNGLISSAIKLQNINGLLTIFSIENPEKSSKGSIDIQFKVVINAEDYEYNPENALEAFYKVSTKIEKGVTSGIFLKVLKFSSQLFSTAKVLPSSIVISQPIISYIITASPTMSPTIDMWYVIIINFLSHSFDKLYVIYIC